MNDVAANLALGGWRPANRNDALLNDAVDVFVACVRYFLVGEMVDTTEDNRKIQLIEELGRVFKLRADRYSDFTIPNSFLTPALVPKNDGPWDAIAGIHAGQALARQAAMAAERRLPVVCFARFDGRHPGVPVRWQLWVRTQRPEPGTLQRMPYVPDWAWAPSGPALEAVGAPIALGAESAQRIAPMMAAPKADDLASPRPTTTHARDAEIPEVTPHPSASNGDATAPTPAPRASEPPQARAPVRGLPFNLPELGLWAWSSVRWRPRVSAAEKAVDGPQDSIVYLVNSGSSFVPRLFGYVAAGLVFYFLGLDLLGTFFGGASALLSKIASVLSGQSLVSFAT